MPIKDIVDLLREFLVRRHEPTVNLHFDLIEPLQDQIIDIHDTYRKLFLETKSALSKLARFDPDRDAAAFKKVKSKFCKARAKRSHLRDYLRTQASTLLHDTRDKEVRRYLITLIHYFLEQKSFAPSERSLDGMIEDAIEKGVTYYHSPSSEVERRMARTKSPSEAREIVEEVMNGLNQRFFEVAVRYTRLKHRVSKLPRT